MKADDRDLCNDSRECFARGESGRCRILSSVYEEDGKCPFRKSSEKVPRDRGIEERRVHRFFWKDPAGS